MLVYKVNLQYLLIIKSIMLTDCSQEHWYSKLRVREDSCRVKLVLSLNLFLYFFLKNRIDSRRVTVHLIRIRKCIYSSSYADRICPKLKKKIQGYTLLVNDTLAVNSNIYTEIVIESGSC